MKFLKSIFKSKGYFDEYGFATFKSINFIGEYKKSQSEKWIICWSDIDHESKTIGFRAKGKGTYILYNTDQKKIIAKGHLGRPQQGNVGNNGFFSLENWHLGEGLKSTFHVISQSGKPIIVKKFNANMYNSAISPNGLYAVCQTAHNKDSNDGNLLTLFDIQNKKELFSIHPKHWAEHYRFNEDIPSLTVSIPDIGEFEYNEKGEFESSIDYIKSCLNSSKCYVVFHQVDEILKSKKQIDYKMLLNAVVKARKNSAEQDPGWNLFGLKLHGILLEEVGEYKDALKIYDQALNLNPKIGVKRRADNLRKKLR